MPDLLREIPENPVPDGAVAGMITAADGLQVRYARFPSKGRNGTVVLLTGRNESIEKYFETVRDLRRRGFSAAALDWRGQGGSERMLRDSRPGHIDSFDEYVRDLDRFFAEIVLPDCRPPYTILAHSTGALVALLATPQLANRVRRMVLVAPLLEIVAPLSPDWLKRIATTMTAFGLGGRMLPGSGARSKENPFQSNRLTHDAGRYARNEALVRAFPELRIGGPTAAWLRAAMIASERVREPEFMAAIRLPILFIAAGADEVVSTPAIERYARGLRSAKVLTIDGARHEILQEADLYREQALAAFEAFGQVEHGDGLAARQAG